MFTGNPVTFNPYAQPNPFPSPLSFMGPLTNQAANPFAQPQAVNPWLVLAWLNQFNPYANAFQQPAPQQFSWQAFWNAAPANPLMPPTPPMPANMAGMWNPSVGQTFAPNFTPGSSSQGIFGTTNFHTAAPAQQAPATGNVPSYPNFPGVPSFFMQPQTVTNPLDEHTPPKRTTRNGV